MNWKLALTILVVGCIQDLVYVRHIKDLRKRYDRHRQEEVGYWRSAYSSLLAMVLKAPHGEEYQRELDEHLAKPQYFAAQGGVVSKVRTFASGNAMKADEQVAQQEGTEA